MRIDGTNILNSYNATLLQGGLKSLLAYPKLKTPDKNDWAEHNGIEVDLEAPKLDKKEVVLSILCNANNIDSFVNFLMLKTYRNYHFTSINKAFKLRFNGISEVKEIQGRCFFNLKLSDDFPLYNYTYEAPNLTASHDFGYLLDGVKFTKYGLIPLEGTNLESITEAKEKLEIKSKFASGVKVAEQTSKKKDYTATLQLFSKQSTANFFKGYNAFLHDLVKSKERILTAKGKTYKCYYQSARIEDFIITEGIVWCKFSININVV